LSSSPKPVREESCWEQIVRASLLGAERGSLPMLDHPSRALLSQLDGSKREASLLSAAAIVSLHQRCGALPALTSAVLPPPAKKDSLPGCGPGAAVYLRRMLKGEHTILLSEFLAALHAAGKRVPEELLPEVLDAARKESSLRKQLAAVVGKRGEWLAAQNEAWNFVGAAISHQDWEVSSRADRVMLLRRLRLERPAEALQLIASTWKQDPPDDRIAFIAELQAGLTMADEAFLDAALDDRRKEVRQKAVEFLAQMPQSGLVRRMIDRLKPLVVLSQATGSKLKKMFGGNVALEITLPSACDDVLQRDGVEPKPPQGKGEKAWWLAQMLALAPVAFWTQHLGIKPEECIKAAAASDYTDDLLPAWAAATRRHPDLEWARALLGYALENSRDNRLLAVLEVLPAQEREEAVIKLLKRDREKLGNEQAGLNLLQVCPGPWSINLGRAVLDLLRYQTQQITAGKIKFAWNWFQQPEVFATRLPVKLADAVQEGWTADLLPQLQRPIQTMIEILNFRSKMLKEIEK